MRWLLKNGLKKIIIIHSPYGCNQPSKSEEGTFSITETQQGHGRWRESGEEVWLGMGRHGRLTSSQCSTLIWTYRPLCGSYYCASWNWSQGKRESEREKERANELVMPPPAWQMKRCWKFYDFALVLIYSKWASRLCHCRLQAGYEELLKGWNVPTCTSV